jgi:hypothetical protein
LKKLSKVKIECTCSKWKQHSRDTSTGCNMMSQKMILSCAKKYTTSSITSVMLLFLKNKYQLQVLRLHQLEQEKVRISKWMPFSKT